VLLSSELLIEFKVNEIFQTRNLLTYLHIFCKANFLFIPSQEAEAI